RRSWHRVRPLISPSNGSRARRFEIPRRSAIRQQRLSDIAVASGLLSAVDSSYRSQEMRLPRLRLSVRAMMILVLILGGGIGWTVNRARAYRRNLATVQ